MVDLEEQLRAWRESGDLHQAATCAIEGYGPEILGFLVTWMRNEDDASEVFAQASEDFWAGLARFEGRSSYRTWFYTLARHAASRLRRSPHRRAERQAPLSAAEDAAERVRSRTLPHLRTDVKDRFAAIREALDPEDRALLVLRVDREMSWNDIARVLAPEESATDDGLTRAAARVRKRFQAVKEEIRERARAAGLLPEG
jgi:RNA polymerase sigma-70 factor (ECF subfamily)